MIDKIKRIKLSRLKPHEIYLNDIFNDLEENYYRTTHIFYQIDEITYFKFEITKNIMYVDKRIYQCAYDCGGVNYFSFHISLQKYFKQYFKINIKYMNIYTNIGKDCKNEHLIL